MPLITHLKEVTNSSVLLEALSKNSVMNFRKLLLGAIWDSAVDINETAIGVPTALFPKNAMLRKACTKYIL